MTRPAARPRRDTARTRDRLLDAAGDLLAERGRAFTLPDLARASGVATATVYRHFADVRDVHAAFYERLLGGLVAELVEVRDATPGAERLDRMAETWVERVIRWGRAATRIRSADGFLERARAGDGLIDGMHGALAPVVADLVAIGAIPPQDVDYAVLLWITIFDERVVVDLRATLGWTAPRIARSLTGSLLGAWRGSESR